jgi:ELWxxDGT repeat protein
MKQLTTVLIFRLITSIPFNSSFNYKQSGNNMAQPQQPYLVKDLSLKRQGLAEGPTELMALNDILYFSASNNPLERFDKKLWKSDGTEPGTVQIPLNNTSFTADTDPATIFGASINGSLYLTLNQTLFKSDGTANGTVSVPSADSMKAVGIPRNYTDVNGTVFFADTFTASISKTDGTQAGTGRIKSFNAADNIGIQSIVNVNGTAYFTFNDRTNGTVLWKSDGTEAGTVLVKDIYPGDAFNPGKILGLTNVNGTLFFAADDGVNGTELWKSDGTTAGTVLVKDINPAKGVGSMNLSSNSKGIFGVLNGNIYFAADDGVRGMELWKSDGTAAGTVLVRDIGGETAAVVNNLTTVINGSSSPNGFTNVNGAIYFKTFTNTNSYRPSNPSAPSTVARKAEIWKTDGTSAGTTLVKTINNLPTSDDTKIQNLTNVNGTLFFSADSGETGLEPWISDGTPNGTMLLKDINTDGVANSINPVRNYGSDPSDFTYANGKVFFTANDGETHGRDLWAVDLNSNPTPANQAPIVANPITNQRATVGNAFNFAVPTNTFSDPDGNSLTYNTTQENGSALPSWLSFNANTLTFSGTPPAGSSALAVKVIATDPSGLSVSSAFGLAMSTPPNLTPAVANAIADTTATIGTAFSFTIPANAFSDPDAGNTLTYSATLADGSTLPTWLTFDANTRTFSGTPPTGTGSLNLQVVATDNGGLSVADAFSVAIGSGNPNPGGNALTGIRKITTSTTGGASNGELITNFVHAGIAGLSGDGRYVVFAADASNLVADDTNNQTDTFLHDRVNNTNIRLADGNGRAGISRNGRYVAYASKNAAGNPVVAVYDTTNQTTTQVNSTSIPANMGLGIFSPIGISDDGRYISVYTGGGVSLVDRTTDTVKIIPLLPGSRVGLNNPAMSPNGTFIIYTQADFGNNANTINGIYRYDIAADTATKISSSDYSTAFISGDSRYLHYLERTGAAQKMDLTDNSVTNGNIDLLGNGVYTGNISQVSEDGQFRVIIADDSLNTVPNDNNGFKDLFITAAGITTANQAPVVANAIADQVATPGAAFSLVIPANAFSDPEGNPLTFSTTQVDGSALPTWLTFDAATKTLSGTPPTGSPAVDIKVTATDSGSLSVSDTFRVSPTNSLTGIPGLSTVGNLFRTDSSLNGFAVNPVSQSPSQKVSEIALFAVDDLTGKIGSLNPTDTGYLAAALNRAKPIFSTLAMPFFATDKREISLNPNQIYQVIEIVDGSLAQTKQQVAAGQTPNNVLFSNSSSNSPIKVIENSDNYRININNNELVLDVTKLAGGTAAIPIGAKSQDLPEGRLIDLTDYAGQTLKINITNASSAYYGNQVGFYEVKDLAGTITVNGQDLRPSDAGYAAAAVRSAILQTDKSGSQSNKDITGGKIYAPVAIANGTFNSFLTNNSNNVNNPFVNDNSETFAYFNYVGANPDKIDHFRLLNNNTFGVEDVYGGGDRDFNDIKMSLTINT